VLETFREIKWITKYTKKCIMLVINKNFWRDARSTKYKIRGSMRFGLDSTDLEGSFRININNMSRSINAPVISISSKSLHCGITVFFLQSLFIFWFSFHFLILYVDLTCQLSIQRMSYRFVTAEYIKPCIITEISTSI